VTATGLRLRLRSLLRPLVLWALGLEEEDRRELVGLVTRERTRIMRNNTGQSGLSADLPCAGWFRDRDGRLTSALWDDGVCWTLERGFFREGER
jgi:hypothetical protein